MVLTYYRKCKQCKKDLMTTNKNRKPLCGECKELNAKTKIKDLIANSMPEL